MLTPTLISSSREELLILLEVVKAAGEKRGLLLNNKKTKVYLKGRRYLLQNDGNNFGSGPTF